MFSSLPPSKTEKTTLEENGIELPRDALIDEPRDIGKILYVFIAEVNLGFDSLWVPNFVTMFKATKTPT